MELLAGGPPCQPFSQGRPEQDPAPSPNGFADPSDERRDLWRSFLEVVTIAQPAAVLMENVPDMVLDKEMFILRTMVHELEASATRSRSASLTLRSTGSLSSGSG